jgi:uncharacterized LabA/DUF88 family protein
MPTAVLVDGGFFLHRYRSLRGDMPPGRVARDLHRMCLEHLRQERSERQLYRIFFYDCPPLSKKAHNPVSGRAIDFSQTPMATWRLAFHDELRKLRKVALRLGYLNDRSGHWEIRPSMLKAIFAKRASLADLTEEHVKYEVRQKGVDMRIGLDIASMAFKRQVDQIILVAGDSDFVPAAKLARREGIDFILDPMWAPIRDDLHEHIDGLRSVWKQDISRRSPIYEKPQSAAPSPSDVTTDDEAEGRPYS